MCCLGWTNKEDFFFTLGILYYALYTLHCTECALTLGLLFLGNPADVNPQSEILGNTADVNPQSEFLGHTVAVKTQSELLENTVAVTTQ